MIVGRCRIAIAIVALLALGPQARAEDESPSAKPPQAQNIEPRLRPGANSFAESQARALLQSKGYADVSFLVNDKDGIWHGTATKDERKVSVSVDFQGHVAEH